MDDLNGLYDHQNFIIDTQDDGLGITGRTPGHNLLRIRPVKPLFAII